MAATGKCILCQDGEVIGIGRVEPTHCYGKGDRPAPPGVLGGFICSCECRWKEDYG